MAELDRASICGRIAQAREEAGLTQPELGAALDPSVHWRTIQTWERGEKDKKTGARRWTVPFDRLGEIAAITGVSRDWLLHGDERALAARAGQAPPKDDYAEVLAALARIEERVAQLLARLDSGAQEAPGV